MKRSSFLFACLLGSVVAACSSEESDNSGEVTPDSGSGTDSGTTGADTDGETPEGDTSAEPEECVYPESNGRVEFGGVVPDMSWEAAYLGNELVDGGFDLYEFHCSPDYDQYDTLIFVVTTVWCPYCPGMMEYIDRLGEQLEQEGALVVFAEVQNASGGPIDTEGAQDHISNYVTRSEGYRVGDADNYEPNALGSQRIIQAFPTTLVIRRDDMTVIADSSRSNYYLPFVEIAMDPEADWSAPGPPTIVPELELACGPEDEEASEGDNNRPDTAPLLAAGDEIDGGVCDANPDYYKIEIAGEWTARLEFTHSDGDLDMYVWDVENDRPLTDEAGSPIGSDSTNDVEEFTYSGPALLMVYGYRNASGVYNLTLSAAE